MSIPDKTLNPKRVRITQVWLYMHWEPIIVFSKQNYIICRLYKYCVGQPNVAISVTHLKRMEVGSKHIVPSISRIFVPSPSELIISGDFNIHADSDLTTPQKFSGILDNFHLTQHINFPLHDDGHTLDLLITRSSSTVITHLSHHESYQSNHKSFTFKFFPHIRPSTEWTTIQYRSYNTIDVDNFKSDILTSPLYTNPASNASDLADQLSSTLKSILDIHAPIKTKTVVQKPHTPWINPEILKPSRNVVDLSDVGVAGSLPLTAWNSEPNATQSDLSFPKPNPHFCQIL